MRVPWRVSIGTTIFGAFVAMGLLLAVLGSYGLYVLNAAGDFVVQLYDRPLMALNFDRAASLDFAEMDKELIRRATAPEREWHTIDAKIERLAGTFREDLAVAAERSSTWANCARRSGMSSIWSAASGAYRPRA